MVIGCFGMILLVKRNLSEVKFVDWASDVQNACFADVNVNFGGFEVFVTKDFLYQTDVSSFFQSMGGKCMPQGVN